jgi:hypothetical protein
MKLIKVADLLANDRDWQGDALRITTISDLVGGLYAHGLTFGTGADMFDCRHADLPLNVEAENDHLWRVVA